MITIKLIKAQKLYNVAEVYETHTTVLYFNTLETKNKTKQKNHNEEAMHM